MVGMSVRFDGRITAACVLQMVQQQPKGVRMWDWAIKLIGAGAVGIAAIMLILSYQAYRALLDLVSKDQGRTSAHALQTLADNLRSYMKVALVALFASAVVQLAPPVLSHLFPPADSHYALAIVIEPSEQLPKSLVPVVKREGRQMVAEADGAYVTEVSSKSNFSISIHALRTQLENLQKLSVNVAQVQVSAPNSANKGSLGFEPAP